MLVTFFFLYLISYVLLTYYYLSCKLQVNFVYGFIKIKFKFLILYQPFVYNLVGLKNIGYYPTRNIQDYNTKNVSIRIRICTGVRHSF